MRFATEYVSLDGYAEEPGQWSGPFSDEQVAAFTWAELKASDALLLAGAPTSASPPRGRR